MEKYISTHSSTVPKHIMLIHYFTIELCVCTTTTESFGLIIWKAYICTYDPIHF